MISAILTETGLPPGCLDLEVTESTAMSDVEQSASQLRELREMGVHISIDDFGTGYSSLNYLKKLPIERLKIDQSFIQDIVTGFRRPCDHRRSHLDGAQDGNQDRCRGRGDRGAARVPARFGMRRGAGISVQQAGAGGTIQGAGGSGEIGEIRTETKPAGA